MKTRSQNLFVTFATLLVLLGNAAQAVPLGTAFTYQGRLADGTNSATGVYDFQFTICDSATNGNIVGGPLTNSAVGVTNGLFMTVLDFGDGVFSGDARWLEIGVRTNGNGSFTNLTPRQSMTPTPYALYAPNAGTAATATTAATVMGSVAASQITGTISATNIGAGTIADANLNNDAYLSCLLSRIGYAGNSVNRYIYRKTLAKLAANQGATILIEGDGLMMIGLPTQTIIDLMARYPIAGTINYGPPNWPTSLIFNQSGGVRQLSPDTNWLGSYEVMTNKTAAVQFPFFWSSGAGVVANAFQFQYRVWTNGGPLQVTQTTNGGTSWAFVTNITALRATNGGAVVCWTNPWPAINTAIQISNSATTGTNMIFGFGWQNTAITNGLIIGIYGQSGGPIPNQVPDAIRAPIWHIWNPDLVLMSYLGPTYIQCNTNNVTSLVTNFLGFYITNMPNTELAWCGEYQVGNQDRTATTNLQLACLKFGYAFFDGEQQYDLPWPAGFNSLVNRGLMADSVHANTAGYAFHGALISQWLGLCDAANLCPYAASAFTGSVPCLSRTYAHYIGGILMSTNSTP
jgi:hypothetical protein